VLKPLHLPTAFCYLSVCQCIVQSVPKSVVPRFVHVDGIIEDDGPSKQQRCRKAPLQSVLLGPLGSTGRCNFFAMKG